MVYLPLPSLAGTHPSYQEAYNRILSSHRRSPLASASSVILLVAPNVDALCASRMLATLFKHDDIAYRIIPVSGRDDVDDLREVLITNPDLHTLILVNMGNYYDLPTPEWFGDFDLKVTVHVIDSSRPQSLVNLFMGGENGERILTWDDGEAEKLSEERKAWEIIQYEPDPHPDDDNSDEGSDVEEELTEDDDNDAELAEAGDLETDSPYNKRRQPGRNSPRKRRRTDDGVGLSRPRISPEEYEGYQKRLHRYYSTGTSHGQSAASTIYILATLLGRADNDFLWLAILGLTFQYTTSRISRETYEAYHAIYYDEVSRLNPQPRLNDTAHSLLSVNPDDMGVRATEELRFMLFRHWTLYDAMFHSSYVAGKLGIWKEKGRQRLTGLLAKMGFSIPQTQQPFSHMDMDLKKTLVQKLNDIAPEYGLVELAYPSFMRCYGFRTQPLSAADAVEGISALLDVAGGMRMEVEIEGMRNGGEWFGGGRVWEGTRPESVTKQRSDGLENTLNSGGENQELGDTDKELPQEPQWWVKNFWVAYDALADVGALKQSLNLAMSLQRTIIRRGTSIIDKQDIRTMRNHRVVILSQGPDLSLFCNPGILTRLALWLIDALRDRLPGTSVGTRGSKRGLPFVVACLDEMSGKYTVIGVMAALDFGQIRKNQFGLTFLDARERSNAQLRYGTFDTSILEIDEKELGVFLEALCEQ
ncbi:hypothetical protein GALMADRAFT_89457 [Galerina marginata CBS 339.88]|uniref:CDC45-like protein n=1 Tax=Galerina marginata (strain CBS 339.88) TaxID=685588 RepID=A0A067TGN3_GALM3|nr:hypothetical protein GALMADRAFT_89457 [Galerina marginata CBS 339.88]